MKRTDQRIAAVVVWYNPTPDQVTNIEAILPQVDLLVIIDNSEEGNVPNCRADDFLTDSKIIYHRNPGNLGIAMALNEGAKLGIANRCKFLLTLDQDSKPAQDMVDRLLEPFVDKDLECIGIIAPFHATLATPHPLADPQTEEMLTVMTSGNLLNLEAYQAVGTFLEELFIDFVDIEYCLRLKSRGFKIIQVNTAKLEHNIGAITKHKHHGREVFVSNHPPLRRYYMSRNRFYVLERYRSIFPAYCKIEIGKFRGEIKGIFLFEKQKFKKIWMTFLGYLDYKRSIVGKYGH